MQLSTVVNTVSQYIFFVNMNEVMDIHDIHTPICIYIYIYFLMFVGKLTFNIFFSFFYQLQKTLSSYEKMPMLTGFELDDSKTRSELKKLNKIHMRCKTAIMGIIRRLSHDNLDDGSISTTSPLEKFTPRKRLFIEDEDTQSSKTQKHATNEHILAPPIQNSPPQPSPPISPQPPSSPSTPPQPKSPLTSSPPPSPPSPAGPPYLIDQQIHTPLLQVCV